MEPLRQLHVGDVVDVLVATETGLRAHAAGIDQLDGSLNIDLTEAGDGASGDTGRHLVVAMGLVLSTVGEVATLTDLASGIDRARLSAADRSYVGHGGRLLLAFLGGLAELCRNADTLDAERLAMALEAGAALMPAALGDDEVRPGGMPAVAAAVASAALAAADAGGDLADVVIEAADRGLDALERTPLQWDPLAETGLVDAGAAGLMVLVDAFVSVVHGDDAERPAYEFPDTDEDDEGVTSSFRYEVSLRVDGEGEVGVLLERAWRSLGDDVRVDGDEVGAVGAVCTDDIGAVIEAAVSLGRPSNIMVRDRRG